MGQFGVKEKYYLVCMGWGVVWCCMEKKNWCVLARVGELVLRVETGTDVVWVSVWIDVMVVWM